MTRHSVEAELRDIISTERGILYKSFHQSPDSGVDSRSALVEIARAGDYFYSRPILTKRAPDEQLADLYVGGYPKALAIFLDNRSQSIATPLLPSSPEMQRWADSLTQRAGRLRQIEHLLEMAADGIVELQKYEGNRFVFRLTQPVTDDESIDVADQQWLRQSVEDQAVPGRDFLARQLPDVLMKMRTLVRPWADHFIYYDDDPAIDRHFDACGIFWSQMLEGGAELPSDAEIGGQPFRSYQAAVALMCGRALKHLSFASELSLQHSRLDLRNLLTFWLPRQRWIDFLATGLGVDERAADKLLNALILDSHYAQNFDLVPKAPLPPLIQLGRDELLMSLWGCLTTPFWFVLRKLRSQFRGDWDSIMDRREDEFRKDLFSVLTPRGIVKIQRPVKIRLGNKVTTDIDAIAFDATQGTLALFQLKWQDPFGSSMRERRSKMKNLSPSANDWIRAVQDWIEATDDQTKLRLLGIPRDLNAAPLRRIALFVVARHHVRFTGSIEQTKDAAWASWPRLYRVALEESHSPDLLWALASRLRAEHSTRTTPRALKSGRAKIRDFVIEVDSGYA